MTTEFLHPPAGPIVPVALDESLATVPADPGKTDPVDVFARVRTILVALVCESVEVGLRSGPGAHPAERLTSVEVSVTGEPGRYSCSAELALAPCGELVATLVASVRCAWSDPMPPTADQLAVIRIVLQHAGQVVRDALSVQVIARQRATIDDLGLALQSNRRIGAAIGILMARRDLTSDQAFGLLRTASQHGNRKLRDVADQVVATGRLPG
ncbi:ANTAR domain-containing protein [Nakamurella leprariae]|nr:ANTAR domain-containing protein [Nakamurella leprariae]